MSCSTNSPKHRRFSKKRGKCCDSRDTQRVRRAPAPRITTKLLGPARGLTHLRMHEPSCIACQITELPSDSRRSCRGKIDPQLVDVMRSALEEVMTRGSLGVFDFVNKSVSRRSRLSRQSDTRERSAAEIVVRAVLLLYAYDEARQACPA